MEKKRTINLMISPEADTRLRALWAELKQPMGLIVERAIMQYQPIESNQQGDKEDRLLALESRVMALESRLEGLGAVGVVSMPEVESVAVTADLVACEPVQSVEAETVEPVAVETVEAGAVNYSTEDWEKAVIALYEPGTKKFQHIADQTYAAGFHNANGKQRDRGHTRKVLVKAGLVEVKDGADKTA